LNVSEKEISQSLRFTRAIPTLSYLSACGARVVILAHRGRPKGSVHILKPKRPRVGKEETLKPFVSHIARELKTKVLFDDSFDVRAIATRIQSLAPGEVLLLENIRFFKGEEKNNFALAHALSRLGTLYVNDAFSASHRAHASVSGVAQLLPAYAGVGLAEEVKALSPFLKKTLLQPAMLVLGGAKMADKIGVLKSFFSRVSAILTGGGVANTLFVARDIPVGDSLYDARLARRVSSFSLSSRVRIPKDVIIHDRRIVDIGPATVNEYSHLLKRAKFIIWNGPMGLYEDKRFTHGTYALWKAMLKNTRARIVIGGGETIASVSLLGNVHINKNIFLSTGGGALLEYLAGNNLPGLKVLR
ncbi:MAG: phosphoglycerate kinase, partial [Candidatus Pacebacteria bacterium]|nr:phosphoglycerate kinase [Candidatus Paceibacterota bacterium]